MEEESGLLWVRDVEASSRSARVGARRRLQRRTRVWSIALVASSLSLTACSAGAGSGDGDTDVPTTSASLAYVAAQYVGEPDLAEEESGFGPAFGEEPLQADLRFDPGLTSDSVGVVVGRELEKPATDCAAAAQRYPFGERCEDLDDGYWYWVPEEPEEDPGGIVVVQRKGDVTVLVTYTGRSIEGDPREQRDLPVEVQTLIDLAADPRIDLTTTEEAVEGGADAAYWRG